MRGDPWESLVVAQIEGTVVDTTSSAATAAALLATLECLGVDAGSLSESWVYRALLRDSAPPSRDETPFESQRWKLRALRAMSALDPEGSVSEVRALLELEPRRPQREGWWELLEDLLFSIFDAHGGGTVDDGTALSIIARARRDWAAEPSAAERASIMAVATVLLPRKVAREWLLEAAKTEADADLHAALTACAETEREGPVV